MPKLEYLFAEFIYIGAIMVVLRKNIYPMIYTDLEGSILGTNKQVG